MKSIFTVAIFMFLISTGHCGELSKQQEFGCKVKLCRSTPKPPKECRPILRKAHQYEAHGRPIPACPNRDASIMKENDSIFICQDETFETIFKRKEG